MAAAGTLAGGGGGGGAGAGGGGWFSPEEVRVLQVLSAMVRAGRGAKRREPEKPKEPEEREMGPVILGWGSRRKRSGPHEDNPPPASMMEGAAAASATTNSSGTVIAGAAPPPPIAEVEQAVALLQTQQLPSSQGDHHTMPVDPTSSSFLSGKPSKAGPDGTETNPANGKVASRPMGIDLNVPLDPDWLDSQEDPAASEVAPPPAPPVAASEPPAMTPSYCRTVLAATAAPATTSCDRNVQPAASAWATTSATALTTVEQATTSQHVSAACADAVTPGCGASTVLATSYALNVVSTMPSVAACMEACRNRQHHHVDLEKIAAAKLAREWRREKMRSIRPDKKRSTRK